MGSDSAVHGTPRVSVQHANANPFIKITSLHLTHGIGRQKWSDVLFPTIDTELNLPNVTVSDETTLTFCLFSFFLERGSVDSGPEQTPGGPQPKASSAGGRPLQRPRARACAWLQGHGPDVRGG